MEFYLSVCLSVSLAIPLYRQLFLPGLLDDIVWDLYEKTYTW